MRKADLIIILSLISVIAYSQRFESNLALSPTLSFNNNETTENSTAFGFLISLQEFYNLTEHVALGTGLNYSYENYKLKSAFDGNSIPESTSYYLSKLTVHSLKLPLILRLKSRSDWILTLGYGMSFELHDKAAVQLIYSDWLSNDVRKTTVPAELIDSGNNLNSFFTMGFGKLYEIKGLHLITELFYNKCFADYIIQHNGAYGTIISYLYDAGLQYAGLKIGLVL